MHFRILTRPDSDGLTPLHKASMEGRFDCVKTILESFPDIKNCADIQGRVPADVAATPEIEFYLRG